MPSFWLTSYNWAFCSPCILAATGNERAPLSMENVQSLLLRGKRNEAVDKAISSGDFSTALLVASMCDRDTYQRAVKRYAEQVFLQGSPLYTVALLFSGQLEAPLSSSSSLWGGDTDELKLKWKYHLAAIISNRTAGWDRIVLALGDRLNEFGKIKAAHFCYMVCGCPVTSPTNPNSRLVLLGCDHNQQDNVELLTEEAVMSYERTEAYEWAKRRGNQNAALRSFQPFKLIYANLLADFGYEENSKRLAQSIRQCMDIKETNRNKMYKVTSQLQLFDDSDAFTWALYDLEHRLKIQETTPQNLLPPPTFGEDEAMPPGQERPGRDLGQTVMIKVDSRIGQEGPPIPVQNGLGQVDQARRNESLRSTPNYISPPSIQDMATPPVQKFEQPSYSIAADSSPRLVHDNTQMSNEASFMSAKSNLLDVTGYSLDPTTEESKSGGRIAGSTAGQRPSTVLENPFEDPPETMPKPQIQHQTPSFMSTPKDEKPMNETARFAATPQETKKTPEKPPMSAPAVMLGKKTKSPKTKQGPSSSDRGE